MKRSQTTDRDVAGSVTRHPSLIHDWTFPLGPNFVLGGERSAAGVPDVQLETRATVQCSVSSERHLDVGHWAGAVCRTSLASRKAPTTCR